MSKNRINIIRWTLTFAITILLGLSSFETESRAFGISAPSLYLLDLSNHFLHL